VQASQRKKIILKMPHSEIEFAQKEKEKYNFAPFACTLGTNLLV
jgi:hypothetical protein